MKTAALIVAAGRGSRATRGDRRPKQYVAIGGGPVLGHTLMAFPPFADAIQVVIHPDDAESYADVLAWVEKRLPPAAFAKILPPVPGGATRQQSVLCGLEALAANGSEQIPSHVLIHDAARPFVSAEEVERLCAALKTAEGAILALPVTDTLKRGDAADMITATVGRENLWRAQTPQGFQFAPILAAHRQAARDGATDLTDDAAVAERAGIQVALVKGSAANIKITTAEDIDMAEAARAFAAETRTGTGFDVHRFTEGDHVWLGGVKIPHTHKLEGHSDADVVLHALTDAILGAMGEADIGQHFPPSDPQWKGAASHIFLAHAAKLVRDAGWSVSNVDVTVLAEAPKIGPHRHAMKALIADALGITPDRVGIKATTMEGMGFVGRGEGLAAQAIATLQRATTPA
ncbi:MAG: bifunctional 2-C-methyl-D-erythritol 4-phosphate cytidylyltransferase/2-C-methyl-D-erythritol 2,4-cyclodiphosphate synthase [Hyphomicrobium sp.]|nr:bifunctional 2-C-methyl-D-erythritol 4-phosphate cytidylyltransferase/2-C-methyl-D-erythritol 2,4-cyclodiphosphate synthase [Hyphomicrobium sp.]